MSEDEERECMMCDDASYCACTFALVNFEGVENASSLVVENGEMGALIADCK